MGAKPTVLTISSLTATGIFYRLAFVKKIDPEFIPHDVPSAIAELVRLLEPADIERIKNLHPCDVHFGMGMFLRNNWNMWDRNTMLNQDFQRRYGLFGHGDDVSGIILHCLWREVCGQPWGDDKVAARYRAHWQRAGLNPKTGEEVPGAKQSATAIIVED